MNASQTLIIPQDDIDDNHSDRFQQEYHYRPCDVPRPCYYMLRILGIWQPQGSNLLMRVYTKCIWLLWAAIIAALFLQMYLHTHKFTLGLTLNNIGTIIDFCCPLIFLRYYLWHGNFERIVSHVYEISDAEGHRQMKQFRYIYTAISLLMWVCSATFFIFHWIPFWDNKWQKWLVYTLVLFFTQGWWSVWFSLYGFVCHVHRNQILTYRKHMVFTLTEDINKIDLDADVSDESQHTPLRRQDGDGDGEKKPIGHLLFEFNDLQNWLNRTQIDFSVIISVAVAYHIFDMFVFSMSYFSYDFGHSYGIGNLCGTILYDLVSILIKLYPAAIVCQALHKTVVTAGDLCVLGPSNKIPYARFEFYQHLCYREQDMGLRILGVKITLQLMIGIFITVGTALMGFLRLIISDDKA